MIKAIVCVDNNWGLGKDNKLLFHIKEDMDFFKQQTMYSNVCMGRKTLESLPNQAPLKNRFNIILCSEGKNYDSPISLTVHSLEELLAEGDRLSKQNEDLYVIGGAQLYKAMLPYCDIILVTRVNTAQEADAYFVNLDSEKMFTLSSQSDIIHTKEYDIQFLTYEKRTN